jgi:hypothetical protein
MKTKSTAARSFPGKAPIALFVSAAPQYHYPVLVFGRLWIADMARLDERTRANLDAALEEACRGLRHGGDALRKKVAERLLRNARKRQHHA